MCDLTPPPDPKLLYVLAKRQTQKKRAAEASESGKEAGIFCVHPSGFVHQLEESGQYPFLTPHLCEPQRHQPDRWDMCDLT